MEIVTKVMNFSLSAHPSMYLSETHRSYSSPAAQNFFDVLRTSIPSKSNALLNSCAETILCLIFLRYCTYAVYSSEYRINTESSYLQNSLKKIGNGLLHITY